MTLVNESDLGSSAPLFERGIYSPSEVGRLTGLHTRTVKSWVTERNVWHPSELNASGDRPVLSFLDLMETRVVRALRKVGFSLNKIRNANRTFREIYKSEYALVSGKLVAEYVSANQERAKSRTKKLHVTIEPNSEAGPRRLIDADSGQFSWESFFEAADTTEVARKEFSDFTRKDAEKAMEQVKMLIEGVEYDDEHFPKLWTPNPATPSIVIDPGRNFGQPIIERTGTPTRAVTRMIENYELDEFCKLMNIKKQEARDAIRFEKAPPVH